MNRHPGLFSLALLAIALAASTAHGQTPPAGASAAPAAPPNIDAIRAASSVATAIPTITQYIAAHTAQMAGGDPNAATVARDKLIDAAGPGATPAFLAEYARLLDTGIAPALKHQNDHVRLNAAIAIARVAERADNAALRGATMTLLNDKSRYVALWGIKAARAIIPPILRPKGKADDLLGAVVKSAATHGQGAIGGPIVVEAYEALMIDALSNDAKRRPAPDAIRAVIPFVHQLLQQRVAAYQKGIPPEPAAETRATLFLSAGGVWPLHTPAQKVTSIQAMSDIIGLAAQHVPAAAAGDLQNLGFMIGRVGAAIAVVPENQSIRGQLEPVIKIDERSQPAQIQDAVAAVVPALKTVKPFAGIKPPPPVAAAGAPVDNAAAATQPTTAPAATGPASTAGAALLSSP